MRLGHKYLFAVIILLFILAGMTLAQSNPAIKEVKAFDGYIRVTWKIDSEVGVDHYEVWRSCGSSIPLCVGTVKLGVFYFDDKTVGLYKTEDQYFSYQVRAIGPNQSTQSNSEVRGIRYTNPSSAPKRTWGSIKAMFR
jgi:hypothetical protein